MATEAPGDQPAGAKADEAPAAGAEVADASANPAALMATSPKARRRSKTEFYRPEEKTKTPLKIDQGKGSKLRDIPNAIFKISKLRADDELITAMHTLMYKRQGTAFKRKRDILDFSGIPYADEEAKAAEVAKAEDKLGRWHTGLLNKLLDCFDLPRGSGEAGQKAYKIERAVEFLMKPKILGSKNKAEMEAKRKERARKRVESAKKKKARMAVQKDKSVKTQKRKLGEESKPRGRPPKKAKTLPKAAKEEIGEAEEAADTDAAASEESNGLTEEVVKKELLKTLEAADLNDLSLKKVMTLLTETLGPEVIAWKPMIREMANQFAQEHAEPEEEGAAADEQEVEEQVEQKVQDNVQGEMGHETMQNEVEIAEENKGERATGEDKDDEEMGEHEGNRSGNGDEMETEDCDPKRTNGVAA